MVELGCRLVVYAGPALAAVRGNGRASVVAVDQALGIRGVDPERVIVPVGHTYPAERLAAVIGSVGSRIKDVHRVGSLRIGENVRVVPGTLAKTVVIGHEAPRLTSVVGAMDSALLGFDHCIYAIGIGARHGDADAAQHSLRQAVSLEFLPSGAAVDRFIKPASRTAAVHAPGCTSRLPECGVENVGVGGIEGDVDAAGLDILVEDLLPGFAAVAGAEDPTLLVVCKGMAERSDERDIGILWVDDQPADGVSIRQADEFPGCSGIDRLVHTVPAHDIAADARFAGSDVDNVWV